MNRRLPLLMISLSSAFILLFTFLTVRTGKQEYKKLPPNTLPKDMSGAINPEHTEGVWFGRKITVPQGLLTYSEPSNVLALVERSERWIEVDLSDQKLYAWEGDELFLESYVSTGLPWWPTPTGEFRIWVKFRASSMEGGEGRNYYYLPNVPYVMFFYNDKTPKYKGYGLHGTYWHEDFGTQRSHGCVNLPTSVARKIYYWAYPELRNEVKTVFTDEGNLGTKLIIHD